MSDDPFVIDDSFESVPDEETELRALVRSLDFAEGFSLLFVRCNQHDQRQRLVAALRERLPQLNIEEIHFREPITHLLDELRWHFKEPPSGAVFVSGLEYSLPKAAEAHTTPLVANLNAARNSFPLVVPCPLVLWVPEYVLTAIARGAPDFFSIRSGVYYFAVTPEETKAFAESLTAGMAWTADSLPLEEKLERIAAIESLLADYQSLTHNQRDYRAEARLFARLGGLYFTLGRWTKAKEAIQQTLARVRESGDYINEGRILNSLGIVYKAQGRLTEAETAFQQSLAIAKELGDRSGEAIALGNLGNVYYDQGQLKEAEAAFQQSLTIAKELGDREGEATTLINLGNIYRRQGRWAEAEIVLQQSLAIWQAIGDRIDEGSALNNLGTIYIGQGRWAEAETAFQTSLAIRQELGDHANEGKSLENLALLRAERGDIAGAIELERRALQILEITEDEAAKAKARDLLAKWEGQMQS